VSWARLSLRAPDGLSRRGASSPSRATPVTFTLRSDLPWLMLAKRGRSVPEEPPHGPARQVLDALRAHGAMFSSDLPAATGRLPVEIQEGLWDLVARGMVTSDGFGAVRALFSRREDWARRHMPERRRLGLRPNPATRRAMRQPGEGRWALLATGPGLGLGPAGGLAGSGPSAAEAVMPTDELAEQVASQLLARWGVVFWDLVAHEDLAVPWREILWALRRFEARGTARGGRFVTGFAGEQYALAEALDGLRHVTRSERKGELVRLSAADPLNLSGVVLPGKRVPAVRTNGIVLRDGLIAPVGGSGGGADSGAEALEEEPAPAEPSRESVPGRLSRWRR
jgi:ATP-dependent Lhr-like helicase